MAVSKMPRFLQREQEASTRKNNFDEVSLGFDEQTVKSEAERCLNCKNAPCRQGCPVGVDIPNFLSALKNGDTLKASKIIKETNSLPSVCGRVCPQENQCEKFCVRNKSGGAVAIGACERFAGDYALENLKPESPASKKNIKVAVIGSGPASLTCSATLAKEGVDVTIFEALHKAGGVLVYGIPEFRLPKKLVKAEIDTVLSLGVKIEYNTAIGRTITIEQLKEEFDAIFIGSGAGLPMFLNIEGENLNGVCSANEYLTRVNLMSAFKDNSTTPIQKGKNVVVIGAGNVAMDSARTALRLGADSVTIVYRRGFEEMPARKEEIQHAKEEGIQFSIMTAPIKIYGENGFVNKIECLKTCLTEADASGRRSPKEIEGSNFFIDTDMVIVSLGTSPNPLLKDSFKQLETSKKGTIIVDENMQTSVEGIYAGGDAVTGSATVILAMGAGRKASESILKKLRNND